MELSKKGIELITEFEGFKKYPYLDGGGVPTVGYGTTYYPDGSKVRMADPGIRKEQAMDYLKREVDKVYGHEVNTHGGKMTQNQFDAMTSFTYNLGQGSFDKSTLLKKHLAGDYDGAAKEFLKWNHDNGKVVDGLTRRREAESALYKG